MAVFSAMKMPEAAIALIAVAVHSACNLLIGFSRKVYQVYTGMNSST
jgi:predicted Zn-dependent protease